MFGNQKNQRNQVIFSEIKRNQRNQTEIREIHRNQEKSEQNKKSRTQFFEWFAPRYQSRRLRPKLYLDNVIHYQFIESYLKEGLLKFSF